MSNDFVSAMYLPYFIFQNLCLFTKNETVTHKPRPKGGEFYLGYVRRQKPGKIVRKYFSTKDTIVFEEIQRPFFLSVLYNQSLNFLRLYKSPRHDPTFGLRSTSHYTTDFHFGSPRKTKYTIDGRPPSPILK